MTGLLGHLASSRLFNQTHIGPLPIARVLIGKQRRQSHSCFFLIQTSTMAGTTVCCPHIVSSRQVPKCHVQAEAFESQRAFSSAPAAALMEDPVLHGSATAASDSVKAWCQGSSVVPCSSAYLGLHKGQKLGLTLDAHVDPATVHTHMW